MVYELQDKVRELEKQKANLMGRVTILRQQLDSKGKRHTLYDKVPPKVNCVSQIEELVYACIYVTVYQSVQVLSSQSQLYTGLCTYIRILYVHICVYDEVTFCILLDVL